MTKRRFEVLDGGGNRSGGSRGDTVARVLCSECRFCEERSFLCPNGDYRPFDACMVNSQQKCFVHNPEGLCPKFESAAGAFVADTKRLLFRLRVLGCMVLAITITMIVWAILG